MYEVLGLSRGASESEIKSAYKKLAMQHHPDRGGDPEKFKEISSAYETLMDPQKRRAVDNPFEGMFGFSQAPQRATKRHEYTITMSLRDVFLGATKTFKITRPTPCVPCGGHGTFQTEIRMGPFVQMMNQPCPTCGGQGHHGSNQEQFTTTIELARGTPDGAQFVRGDSVFYIKVAPDPVFTRRGEFLVWTREISFEDSVEGLVLECPHFDGPLSIDTVPWGVIDPRREYVFQDVITKFNIVYPDPGARYKLVL